jgi:hypothetical protein
MIKIIKEFTVVFVLLAAFTGHNVATAQSSAGSSKLPGLSPDSPVEIPGVAPTGATTISIPLWEISLRGLTLPIGLTYTTSGIRVDDVSTAAGLGWRLNTGGGIYRSVRGFADEYGGDYNLDYNSWFDLDIDNIPTDLDSLKSFYEGEWDFSPDQFSFSIPGEGGGFMFDTTGTIHFTQPTSSEFTVDLAAVDNPTYSGLVSTSGLSVIDYSGHIDFSIRDSRGNYYKFRPVELTAITVSKTNQSTESADELGFLAHQHTVSDGVYVTGWGLDTIITSAGDTVTFTYSSYTYTISDYPIGKTYSITQNPPCLPGSTREEYWITKLEKSVAVFLPSAITTPSEEIILTYQNEYGASGMDTRLSEVEVKDLYSDNTAMLYQLNHSLYGGDQRLRLDSLEVFGNDASNTPLAYRFSYHQGSLPAMGHHGQDLYGYQNGNQVEHMMPSSNVPSSGSLSGFPYSQNPADRRSDTYIKRGSLESIVYPMGAEMIFDYEPNSQGSGQSARYAPGMRVKEITLKDNRGSIVGIKEYQYGDIRGFRYGEVGNFYTEQGSMGSRFEDLYGSETPTAFYLFSRYTSSPHTRYRHPVMSGFAYEWILEKRHLNDNQDKAFVKTTYEPVISVDSYTPRMTGRLFLNSDSITVREENFTYNYPYQDTLTGFIRGLSYLYTGWYGNQYSDPCQSGQGKVYYSMQLERFFLRPYLLSTHTISELYPGGVSTTDTITTESIYSYNNLFLPAQVTQNVYQGGSSTDPNSIVTNRRYAADYDGDSPGTLQSVKDLLQNGIRGVATEEWTVRGGKLTTATSYIYNQSGQPETISRYSGGIVDEPPTVWNNHTGFSGISSSMSVEQTIAYDTNGNPTVVTTPQGSEVTLWGYNGRLPIAKATNLSNPDSLYYTSFEENASGTPQEDAKTGTYYHTLSGAYNTTRNMPAGNYILTYFHRNTVNDPWVLQTETKPLGQPGTISTDKTSGQIDELRIYPATSRVETTTYLPLTGATSQTDANGRTTYYHYDHFGRLELIKNYRGDILRSITYNPGR